MYQRARAAEFLLPICLLSFVVFWIHAFYPYGSSVTSRIFAAGAIALSDDAIHRKLVGNWVMPRSDATGPDDIDLRTLRLFNGDGTGTLFIYEDTDCTQLTDARAFNWSVQDGYLLSHFEGGPAARNEIISVTDSSFLFSDRNNVAHRRNRRDSCARF